MYYGNLPLAPSLGVVTAEEGVETEEVLALRLLLSTRLSRLTDGPSINHVGGRELTKKWTLQLRLPGPQVITIHDQMWMRERRDHRGHNL